MRPLLATPPPAWLSHCCSGLAVESGPARRSACSIVTTGRHSGKAGKVPPVALAPAVARLAAEFHG